MSRNFVKFALLLCSSIFSTYCTAENPSVNIVYLMCTGTVTYYHIWSSGEEKLNKFDSQEKLTLKTVTLNNTLNNKKTFTSIEFGGFNFEEQNYFYQNRPDQPLKESSFEISETDIIYKSKSSNILPLKNNDPKDFRLIYETNIYISRLTGKFELMQKYKHIFRNGNWNENTTTHRGVCEKVDKKF